MIVAVVLWASLCGAASGGVFGWREGVRDVPGLVEHALNGAMGACAVTTWLLILVWAVGGIAHAAGG